MRSTLLYTAIFVVLSGSGHAQLLKSVIYDFDGLNAGQVDLPEGDYSSGDLTRSVEPSPLPPADMIGDRVLKLNLNWQSGHGLFGRGISRYIQLDATSDKLNFFFYNPPSNAQDAQVTIMLADDDDQSNNFNVFADDCWRKHLTIPTAAGWQLVSVPLSDFTDDNAGGNSIMDMAFTQNKGMLLLLELRFDKPVQSGNAVFFLDMISFSDGDLPHGASVLELPPPAGEARCPLGAYMKQDRGQEHLTAPQFEGLFSPSGGRRLKYVNYFLDWSTDGGTVANELPGNEVALLLADGYTPVITWEPMFQFRPRLDPAQPRLQNILNGEYNTYIDQVAQKIKSYGDTVIIRFMHEFEGDWYPWSICRNGNDAAKYVSAFRMVVERFRMAGANNVKWMWCVNSDYAPYEFYNWIVPAYPGDSYVDIVATDIYNNHFPENSPWWKSFRIQAAESYYYLVKYFSHKPLYICEVGCRERFSSESTASESKGAWYARMDKELQSNFRKSRALIFFNAAPDQNWFVNSSPYALQSLTENIWQDDYYFERPNSIGAPAGAENGLFVYPNPTNGAVTIRYSGALLKAACLVRVTNSLGETVYEETIMPGSGLYLKSINFSSHARGVYFVEIYAEGKKAERETRKLIYP
jgi:beta-mannanase